MSGSSQRKVFVLLKLSLLVKRNAFNENIDIVPFACRKGDRGGDSTCKKATDEDFLTGKKDS